MFTLEPPILQKLMKKLMNSPQMTVHVAKRLTKMLKHVMVMSDFTVRSTQVLEHIKRRRHHFAYIGLYSQSYGFSSSHVQMWELDHKEGWAPKNCCFWTVVLEKTLENPLHSKEIHSVNPKGNPFWIFIKRTDADAEAPPLRKVAS